MLYKEEGFRIMWHHIEAGFQESMAGMRLRHHHRRGPQNKILQEDSKLLMWCDQAVTRTGDEYAP